MSRQPGGFKGACIKNAWLFFRMRVVIHWFKPSLWNVSNTPAKRKGEGVDEVLEVVVTGGLPAEFDSSAAVKENADIFGLNSAERVGSSCSFSGTQAQPCFALFNRVQTYAISPPHSIVCRNSKTHFQSFQIKGDRKALNHNEQQHNHRA